MKIIADTHTQTHADEYSIVSVDKPQLEKVFQEKT